MIWETVPVGNYSKIVSIAFVLQLLFTASLTSQTHYIQVEHLSERQGLSQSEVFSILQDSKGFMWFGTINGLNRYDGYNFKAYQHDPADSNSISANVAHSIIEDRAGILWIATSNGLNRFDPESEQFTGYLLDGIRTVYEDKSGVLWIGTSNDELLNFERETEKFRLISHDSGDTTRLCIKNPVYVIYEDRLENLWLAPLKGGLNRLDRETGRFYFYRHDPDNPETLADDGVYSIYEDRQGVFWVGTGLGLNKLDRETGQVERYCPAFPGDVMVYSLLEDQTGKFWVGIAGALFSLNRETGTFTRHRYNLPSLEYLENDLIYALYEDRPGNIWISCLGGGLLKYSPSKQRFNHNRNHPNDPNSITENMVVSLFEDRYGDLWIGTADDKLNRIDRATGRLKQYVNDPGDMYSISNERPTAFLEDRSGTLWLGTDEGINKFERESGRFINFQNDTSALYHMRGAIMSLHEDRSGVLWIGTLTRGLFKYDPCNNQFTLYRHDSENPSGLSDNAVWSIWEDSCHGGVLWLGTNGGLNRFDPATGTFIHYWHNAGDPNSLSNDHIFVIHEDHTGALWLGTFGGGLDKFDREKEQFIHFRESDGLPNDFIQGILEDEKGNLWLSTLKGLSKFNPESETFRNYDYRDGLQANEFSTGFFKSKSGEMFFGGINGFNVFYPETIKDNPSIPPVVITDFQIFNKTVLPGVNSPLKKSISETDTIILSHQQSVFSFDFAALDFTTPEKNRYAYKMEGVDPDWVYTDASRRFATYTQLDPGEYVFHVKGSNNDGVWNEEGTSIKIIVTPPFWKRSWFLIVACLLLLSGIVVMVRSITTRKLQQQLHALEHQRAMEKERSRISSDMHDEVGASLTHIAITSELLKKSLSRSGENEVHEFVEDISGTAREVIDSISEIIWAINPRNDSLDNLIAYIRQYAGKMFEVTPIRCRFNFPENIPLQTLTAEVRRNIFLVVKETLNNILKHAGAQEVQLTIDIQGNDLEISIQDNGKGFCAKDISRFGNGLINMKKRMEDIGGYFGIHSHPGEGTRITITVRLG